MTLPGSFHSCTLGNDGLCRRCGLPEVAYGHMSIVATAPPAPGQHPGPPGNRAERRALRGRHLAPDPEPTHRLERTVVEQAIPVAVTVSADGVQSAIDLDTAEPCYDCGCCRLWTHNLEKVRAALGDHHEGRHADFPTAVDVYAGCLVCQMLGGRG